jgi:hypothetical protein
MDSATSEYLKDIVEKLLVLIKGLSFQNPVVFLATLILAVYAVNLLNKNYEEIITFIENNLIKGLWIFIMSIFLVSNLTGSRDNKPSTNE